MAPDKRGNPRRQFVMALLAAAVAPGAFAQPAPMRKLGILGTGSPGDVFGGDQHKIVEALAKLGYVQGRNLEVVERFERESPERLFANARELVALGVDAILTEGTPSTLAAQAATRTIPIVTTVGDPVGAGFAKALNRPGGNITGFSQNRNELARKQLDLVRLMRPGLAAIAIVYPEPFPGIDAMTRAVIEAAGEVSMAAPVIPFKAGGFPRVLEELRRARIKALVSIGVPKEGVETATRQGIAVVGAGQEHVEDGALLSIENDGAEDYLEAASVLAKVFRGANPAQIPFSLPTRYRVTVNAKTAAALGIPLTAEVRLRVDRIVEH